MRWAAWVDDSIIFGEGRAFSSLVNGEASTLRMKEETRGFYSGLRHLLAGVGEEIFTQAMASALAARDHTPREEKSFTRASDALRQLQHTRPAMMAVKVFNGITASSFAQDKSKHKTSTPQIAEFIAQAFKSGRLLDPVRDVYAAYQPLVQDELPGALVFLVNLEKAKKDAFEAYLRRGAAPALSFKAQYALDRTRPVQSTWMREARLESEATQSRGE